MQSALYSFEPCLESFGVLDGPLHEPSRLVVSGRHGARAGGGLGVQLEGQIAAVVDIYEGLQDGLEVDVTLAWRGAVGVREVDVLEEFSRLPDRLREGTLFYVHVVGVGHDAAV